MKTSTRTSLRFWSITSGISILTMAVLAGYAYGYSFNQIYIKNNTLQTLSNIDTNGTLFYSGAVTWCVILLTDIIVSYGFYRYFRPTLKLIAFLSAFLRLVYSGILAIGIVFLFEQKLHTFLTIWSLGLIIFGFHLTITGIGAIKNLKTPNLFGYLLIIAGASYSVIHGLQNFVPQAIALSISLEKVLILPMSVGELAFGVWLIYIGYRKVNQQPSNDPVPDAS